MSRTVSFFYYTHFMLQGRVGILPCNDMSRIDWGKAIYGAMAGILFNRSRVDGYYCFAPKAGTQYAQVPWQCIQKGRDHVYIA